MNTPIGVLHQGVIDLLSSRIRVVGLMAELYAWVLDEARITIPLTNLRTHYLLNGRRASISASACLRAAVVCDTRMCVICYDRWHADFARSLCDYQLVVLNQARPRAQGYRSLDAPVVNNIVPPGPAGRPQSRR